MPGSRYEQIEVVVDLMIRLKPRSILDVGIGNGLYGMLARQYVDASGPFADSGIRLEGIEIFEGYLTNAHRAIYDEIHLGDALEILPTMAAGRFDLALALDLIEHLPDPMGSVLLDHLRRVACNVIVTSPRSEFPQGALFGNRHEAHVSQWAPERLRKAGAALIAPHPFISIALFTADAAFVRYYRSYLRLKRVAALAPVGLLARLSRVEPLRRFATRGAHGHVEDT